MNRNARLTSEFLGTYIVVSTVVGSGIMASQLTDDKAVMLLMNSISTAAILLVSITLFSKYSGAHFNPAVSLFRALTKQLGPNEFLYYLTAQVLGALAGVITAHVMFDYQLIDLSTHARFNFGTFVSEIIATFGLLMIVALQPQKSFWLVPAWIGGAYFFTSSTSFANPAVTLARSLTNSFSGIAPSSVLPFIAAQIVATLLASISLARFFKET